MKTIPFLFLPGTLCTGAIFEHQVKTLAGLSIQSRTVGFSCQDSIRKMAQHAVDSAEINSPVIAVGFSMGGMVAMALAEMHPELIAGIVLISTNAHSEIPQRHAARQAHLNLARELGITSVIRNHYLDNYLLGHQAEHRDLILEMADELGIESFESQSDALATRPDPTHFLSTLPCPALIIGGENDPFCPPAEQVRMNRIIPNSELVLIENCGHFSILEQSEAVSLALTAWYKTNFKAPVPA